MLGEWRTPAAPEYWSTEISEHRPLGHVKMVREADRSTVSEVAKRNRVGEQTLYAWRKKLGELEVADAERPRSLETERALTKLLAERDLEIEVMKQISAKKW